MQVYVNASAFEHIHVIEAHGGQNTASGVDPCPQPHPRQDLSFDSFTRLFSPQVSCLHVPFHYKSTSVAEPQATVCGFCDWNSGSHTYTVSYFVSLLIRKGPEETQRAKASFHFTLPQHHSTSQGNQGNNVKRATAAEITE